jgi:hypothetical protein
VTVLPPLRRRLYPSWDRAVQQPYTLTEYNQLTITGHDMALYESVVVTIPAGSVEASAIDSSKGELVRVVMPEEWTPAVLTFEMSVDGVDYHRLVDPKGSEVRINMKPGTTVIVPQDWRALAFIKLCSGTSDRPITQTEQRDFVAVIKV